MDGRLLSPDEPAEAIKGSGHIATAEAVARGFAEIGPALFSLLDGEFALTVVDHRTDRVYLVRDRVGMRPLFWARTPDGGVLWASECKMLLPLMSRRQLDAMGLAESLLFRWLAGERTLFAGIHRIFPGSYLVLERGPREVNVASHLYWRFETAAEPPDRPISAWVDEAELRWKRRCRVESRVRETLLSC